MRVSRLPNEFAALVGIVGLDEPQRRDSNHPGARRGVGKNCHSATITPRAQVAPSPIRGAGFSGR
jgi:hypothetical protein